MKNKIYVDFDNTLFDSSKAFLQAYDVMVGRTNKTHTLCWDFDDCNIDKSKIASIFDSALFMTYLQPFEGALETLNKLAELTEVNIVTIGTYENIKSKIWKLETLDLTKNIGMIPIIKPKNKSVVMNKEIIPNGILIDDHPNNLKSSNAEHKVLFSWQDKSYDWQKDYTPQYKMTAWNDEGYELLLKLIKGEE